MPYCARMITRSNLMFEPPEPPPHRPWPEYVCLTYGYPSGVTLENSAENDRQFGLGYLGWMIRMGYHLIGRISEQTRSTSDEAVLSVALLLDLQTERSFLKEESGGGELLDELRGQLLAQLRRYSLPTGVVDYQDDDALAIFNDWANCTEGVRSFTGFILSEYLSELEDVMRARGRVTVRQWHTSASHGQAEAATSLRTLAEQIESGAMSVTELRTVEHSSTIEVRIRGQVPSDAVSGSNSGICPECI